MACWVGGAAGQRAPVTVRRRGHSNFQPERGQGSVLNPRVPGNLAITLETWRRGALVTPGTAQWTDSGGVGRRGPAVPEHAAGPDNPGPEPANSRGTGDEIVRGMTFRRRIVALSPARWTDTGRAGHPGEGAA